MAAPAEHITATILGCGSSGGVPRVGNVWGACDPGNPKNRRRRCALLVTGRRSGSDAATQVVIDTGCDLREQLLDAEIGHLDGVLYTHSHADHIHGIDDLRVLALNSRKRVDVYFSEETGQRLYESFGYCFQSPPGSQYPPILTPHTLAPGQEVDIDGPGGVLRFLPFMQEHGDISSTGFRIGGLAYSCDLNGLPPESQRVLQNLDVWIVDALRPAPHPTHWSLPETLGWIERVKPRQAVLTNMHIDLDYTETEATTPAHVTPAYDGMVIDVTRGKVLAA